MKSEKLNYVIGIDPGQATAISLFDAESKKHMLTWSGLITEVNTHLLSINRMIQNEAVINVRNIGRVLIYIEWGRWYRGNRGVPISVFANPIISNIKKVWPRKNQINQVYPNTWQKQYKSKGVDREQLIKMTALGVHRECKNVHEYDSICLGLYGINNYICHKKNSL